MECIKLIYKEIDDIIMRGLLAGWSEEIRGKQGQNWVLRRCLIRSRDVIWWDLMVWCCSMWQSDSQRDRWMFWLLTGTQYSPCSASWYLQSVLALNWAGKTSSPPPANTINLSQQILSNQFSDLLSVVGQKRIIYFADKKFECCLSLNNE